MNRNDLEKLLVVVDTPVLECDGATRVAYSLLYRKGIKASAFIGRLSVPSRGTVSPHFWLELENGLLVDFKARMWLGGGMDIPHGVFLPSDFATASYEGELLELEVLGEGLVSILLEHFPT